MVRPAKAFTAEQASEKDLEIIEAQLGRTPRDVLAIAHRCPCGAPDVVQTPPRLADGTPFPTFYYVGTIDGHNFDQLIPVLKNVRDSAHQGPFLVHAITQKGKGYVPAENSNDKYHGDDEEIINYFNQYDVVLIREELDKGLFVARAL